MIVSNESSIGIYVGLLLFILYYNCIVLFYLFYYFYLLLFLIYINDLPNVSKVLSFFLFADDTNIYYKSHDLTHLQKIIKY